MKPSRPWRQAALWMFVAGALFFLTYSTATWLTAQRAVVPSIAFAWERRIPFLAWTVIPYWSTDLLFVLSFFLCATRRELDVHGKRLIAAQIFCVMVFLVFPLRFSFARPALEAPYSFFFRALGSFDKPFNQAPSLHLALTTILWAKYSEHTHGLPRLLLRMWLALTAVSTLTTYQHHFIDLPTGVWVGLFCLALFPGNKPVPRLSFERQRLRLAALYLAGSAGLVAAAALVTGLGWLLLWPAGALLTVAVAYLLGWPQLIRNQNGKMGAAAFAVLAPYLVIARVNAWLWGHRHPPADEIVPGVWLGRWPTRRERERLGVASIVSLAPEVSLDTRGITCRSVPMLDLVIPSSGDLDDAVHAVDALQTQRPTLICCALGYSRSASAVVAWLITKSVATSVDSAIDMVRTRRPRVVLTAAHRAQLKAWADRRIGHDR